jgi:hypothetical protein
VANGFAEGADAPCEGGGAETGCEMDTEGWPSSSQTFGEGWLGGFHLVGKRPSYGPVRQAFTMGPGMPGTSSTQVNVVEQRTGTWAELNDDDYYGDDNDKENDLDIGDIDPQSVRWRFRDETWSHAHFTYAPPQIQFRGQRGPTKHYHAMPTFMHLFDLFWSYQTLRSIVRETNWYAMYEVDKKGKRMGEEKWESLTVAGLKAFLGVSILMGMKKQPNLKSYW